MLFYTINIAASQNSSCVLKLVRKDVEPNFTYLSCMVQDLEQRVKFHFYSISERGRVKVRLGGGGDGWGDRSGPRPPWTLSLPPVLRLLLPQVGLPVSLSTLVNRLQCSLHLWNGPSGGTGAWRDARFCAWRGTRFLGALQPPRGGHCTVVPSLATLTSCGWRPLQQGVGEAGAWVFLCCCLTPGLMPPRHTPAAPHLCRPHPRRPPTPRRPPLPPAPPPTPAWAVPVFGFSRVSITEFHKQGVLNSRS